MATALRRDERAQESDAESPPSVLAVVVTHNGRPWLKHALTALNVQTYPFLDVLVVDDASPDWRDQPHLKRVAKRHIRRRRWAFMRTPRPLGFGAAINWALSRVRTDANLLLFLHDDAELTPSSVESMVARLNSEEGVGIVGPKVVSWDNPARLEEVGMAVDRFGFPYKGLEPGEIDLGQHDTPAEVFYVTSTCMLIRHDLFRQLRGWDARMRAFSEDLDLCWRARLAGYGVRVEPAARARHAVALASGLRRARFTPTRYYNRRNRLRTIAKNSSGVRLIATIPLFVLLTFAEMIGFIILRQPREVLNLTRALMWNLLASPQTLSERARVQRHRRVPDRKLGRLTVPQSARVRLYLSHRADRIEEAWGRRAEILALRRSQARALRARLIGRWSIVGLVGLIALLVAFRHYLWGPAASAGELLPYPESSTGLIRAFLSPWRSAWLGSPDPAPPAFLLLSPFHLISFGATGAAQKLLVFLLGAIAVVGAYRMLADVVDRSGRVAAAAAYAFSAIGYAGVREGALGALVFGAAAPFFMRSLIRLSGWARPHGWHTGREIAAATLAAGVSAAFVPGSLAILAMISFLLVVARTLFALRRLRLLVPALAPLAFAWALLLPWSANWFEAGGPLEHLLADESWQTYAHSFAEHGTLSVVLGQSPSGPVLLGLAFPVLGLVAVLATVDVRRRLALCMWVVVAAIALMISLIASGAIRPIVASVPEASVVAWTAFAALVGLAIGGFRLDLPRRGLGAAHALAVVGIALGALMAVAGAVPAIWAGRWTPGGAAAIGEARIVEQIRSVISADVNSYGAFRTLWVGQGWFSGGESAAVPPRSALLSGSRGRVLLDLFDPATGEGTEELDRIIASIEIGSTDRGGNLLGALNVRYIVVEEESAGPWLAQRDLAVARDGRDDGYFLLENQVVAPRAAVFDRLPRYVGALAQGDEESSAGEQARLLVKADQRSASRYFARSATGPGIVFLAETRDANWRATVEGARLQRASGGWANAFEVSGHLDGALSVSYPRPLSWFIRMGVLALAWIVVLGGAFSRRRRPAREGAA
jgi:GT2 family glycosyltransferase